ncbi:MAG: aspartate dehydrogenase [Rhodobacteraceae bacterium]|nr:aspartate dehydrogenase [Paracoccaceae bacterium]
MHLGLIGFGAIGQALLAVLAREGAMPEALTVLARPGSEARVQAALAGRGAVVARVAALADARPDLVVEAAGHGAVAEHLPELLGAGIECVLASVGALADAALAARLEAAAQAGGARLVVSPGAIGGVDLLAALRPSGIEAVRYTGRKPPLAWAGSPAEAVLDLRALDAAATFFTGSARAAARDYPKNANVAATVALAGAGFDATQVALVADPGVRRNIHEISVQAGAGAFDIRIEGVASPDNPRTSLATVHALAREVMNRRRALVV